MSLKSLRRWIVLISVIISWAVALGQTDQTKFPPKIRAYINKVEKESGRQLLIERRRDPKLRGFAAAFIPDPKLIRVILDPEVDLLDPGMEHTLAHELTHGLLIYARGYSNLQPKRRLSEKESYAVGLIATMVDDLVVNKIVQAEGFSPFSAIYPATVKKETEAAQAKTDYYIALESDPELRSKYMVLRYIMAWGLVEFNPLEYGLKEQLSEFLKAFEAAFPREFAMAVEVRTILKENNVFEANGHRKALTDILALWKLGDAIQITTE